MPFMADVHGPGTICMGGKPAKGGLEGVGSESLGHNTCSDSCLAKGGETCPSGDAGGGGRQDDGEPGRNGWAAEG